MSGKSNIMNLTLAELYEQGWRLFSPAQVKRYEEMKDELEGTKLLKGVEVAKWLGVDPAQITRLRKSGKIPAHYVGKSWKYMLRDVKIFIKSNKI